MKKIGIITTGGDCSGLNSAIYYLKKGAELRGWDVVGIYDGTDGIVANGVDALGAIDLSIENIRDTGSILRNELRGELCFKKMDKVDYNVRFRKNFKSLGLDALVLIGGNGSLSLAHTHNELYCGVQLVCIPKTIDADVPNTDNIIGFDTAVHMLASFADQILQTARSHHRWFIIQSMGRDAGHLALSAGLACGADAILIPEVRFDTAELISHIQSTKRDYGIIIVAEGITLRGRSGAPAEIISRELTAAGIENRTSFPEHLQRVGDTVASDRLLASGFAACALSAIENGETNVMTALQDGTITTIGLSELSGGGVITSDPNFTNMEISNRLVAEDDPRLSVAITSGIYIGTKV